MRLPFDLGQVDAFFHHLVQGRKLTKFLHNIDDLGGDIVHFGLRVEAAQAKADGTVRHIVAEVQAEPLETATSLMPISSDSPST